MACIGGDLNEWLAKTRPWLMKCLSPIAIDLENETYIPHEVSLYLAGSDEPVKNLVIHEDVTAIPEEAFRLVNMASLTLPASMTEIGARAFEGCKTLATVKSKAAVPPTLGADAFKDIDEKAKLNVYASAVDAYKASEWSKYFTIEGTEKIDDALPNIECETTTVRKVIMVDGQIYITVGEKMYNMLGAEVR